MASMRQKNTALESALAQIYRNFIDVIVRHLQRQGLNRERFIQQLNLPCAVDDLQQLTRQDFMHCLDYAKTFSGDSAFVLNAGCRAYLSDFPLFGSLAMHAKNLKQVLEDLTYFYNSTSMGGMNINLHIVSGTAHLRFLSTQEYSADEFADMVNLSVVSLISAAFNLVGDHHCSEFGKATICFQHAAPPDPQTYQRIFNVPVHFKQNYNEVIFDEKFLYLPVLGYHEPTYRFIRDQLKQRNALLLESTSMGERVHSILMILEQPKACAVGKVAEALNTSVSTLQRKLKTEQMSYTDIQADVVKQRATKLLLSTHRAIDDIASELGYNETSSFYRAFKRWMGVSPGEYRENTAN